MAILAQAILAQSDIACALLQIAVVCSLASYVSHGVLVPGKRLECVEIPRMGGSKCFDAHVVLRQNSAVTPRRISRSTTSEDITEWPDQVDKHSRQDPQSRIAFHIVGLRGRASVRSATKRSAQYSSPTGRPHAETRIGVERFEADPGSSRELALGQKSTDSRRR